MAGNSGGEGGGAHTWRSVKRVIVTRRNIVTLVAIVFGVLLSDRCQMCYHVTQYCDNQSFFSHHRLIVLLTTSRLFSPFVPFFVPGEPLNLTYLPQHRFPEVVEQRSGKKLYGEALLISATTVGTGGDWSSNF